MPVESPLLISKIAPLSSNTAGPHPALIFLHGRGTDENDLLELTPFIDPHFLIASVRAPYPFSFGGYTWFDLDENNTPSIDQVLESHDRFIRWLDEFQNTSPIDPAKIFLFGFSMGAMMSYLISLLHPDRFKGVVAHSGLLPMHERIKYRWDELRDLSFCIAHGEFDPIIPVEAGRHAHTQLSKINAHVTYREYPIQHTISETSLADITSWLRRHIEG